MIILGIDPGSYHLGLGFINKDGPRLHLLCSNVIHAPKSLSLFERLEFLHGALKRKLKENSPHEIAVEDTFFAKNARSAFHLGLARGVAIAACLGRGVKIFEYAPNAIKATITGFGRADKGQVKKMIELILGSKVEESFDATDALAVAICHASQMKVEASCLAT